MSRRGASRGLERDFRPEEIIDSLCRSITERVGDRTPGEAYECQTIAEFERMVWQGRRKVTCKKVASIEEWERQVAEAIEQREKWENKAWDESEAAGGL